MSRYPVLSGLYHVRETIGSGEAAAPQTPRTTITGLTFLLTVDAAIRGSFYRIGKM